LASTVGPPCRAATAGPGRAGTVPPCLTVLWDRPSAHDTAHRPFTRVVLLMGHNHFRRVVSAHGTTHMIHQRRREGRKGGRRGAEEGVVGEVSSHRSRGGELKANNGRRRRTRMRAREAESCGCAAGGGGGGCFRGRDGAANGFIWACCTVGWAEPASGQKSRWGNGAVPRTWSCRARVVSWVRPAAHALH
jgi:hypothetical protein